MLKVTLYNFKQKSEDNFECIQYEIEKGYYKFYMTKSQVKYYPSYEFVLDVTFPFELEIS